MDILLIVGSAIIGYLLGSISFSIILTKLSFKKDVRDSGSGNAGATNVARVFGLKAGLATLGCDILKTFGAMWIGLALFGEWGVMVAGMGAILGHCFPLYFGFKGGKAVSVTGAVAIFLDWRVAIVGFSVFLIVAFISRYVSLGSIIAALSLIVSAFIFSLPIYKGALLIFASVVAIIMHNANIGRLIKGTEPKFKAKSK